MRKLAVLLLGMVVVLVACNDKTKYTIKGHISNAEDKYVYLDELKVSTSVPLDSVLIGKDGSFKFSGKVSQPSFFLLRLDPTNFVTLLVDSAEQIEVQGDAANFSRHYSVVGSEGSAFVQQLNQHLSRTKHQLDSIKSLQLTFVNDPDYLNKKAVWDTQYNDIRQRQIEYSQKFVSEHPFSMANVLALYQRFSDDTYVIQDLQSLKVAASALNSFYPNSEHVQALYKNTLSLMAEQRASKMKDMIQAQGINSPDITLPDADGNNISLSSLRGKYVLLQFWSANDRGSRIFNSALVDAYDKYKSRGFEIYQVTIDENRLEWQDAVKKDNLSWINVGDMKGSAMALQLYNVTALPTNYLLDKEGQIVAKNLQGPQLDQTLRKLLK